jgi:hypothetical protein
MYTTLCHDKEVFLEGFASARIGTVRIQPSMCANLVQIRCKFGKMLLTTLNDTAESQLLDKWVAVTVQMCGTDVLWSYQSTSSFRNLKGVRNCLYLSLQREND